MVKVGDKVRIPKTKSKGVSIEQFHRDININKTALYKEGYGIVTRVDKNVIYLSFNKNKSNEMFFY